MLGKLHVSGHPTNLDSGRQEPTVLAVGAGGVVTTFCLSFIISLFFSPSLWKSVSYILKFCLKGPLDPKQPIVQKFSFHTSQSCFYCSGPI